MNSLIKQFIPLVITVTLICGLIYFIGQQNLRMSANDPQIQMSEDLAASLSNNKKISLVSIGKVDISKSLAPYVIVFNSEGGPIESTAILDGKIPVLPKGVFEYAKNNMEDRFTWQPKSGVRSAAVLTYYKGENSSGFILSGRSLREIEKREDQLLQQVFLAWILILAGVFITVLLVRGKTN